MTDTPQLRILLAEDSATNADLIVRSLEKKGHDIVWAQDGEQAVRLALAEDFDGILMDCEMPVLDGFEATAAIRKAQSESGKRTPIVAMTAHSTSGDEQECLAKGMDAFMGKPVSIGELRKKILVWFAKDD